MSQEEILNFLEENKDCWFDAKELSDYIGKSKYNSIRHSLKQLRKMKLVNFQEVKYRKLIYSHKENLYKEMKK